MNEYSCQFITILWEIFYQPNNICKEAGVFCILSKTPPTTARIVYKKCNKAGKCIHNLKRWKMNRTTERIYRKEYNKCFWWDYIRSCHSSSYYLKIITLFIMNKTIIMNTIFFKKQQNKKKLDLDPLYIIFCG